MIVVARINSVNRIKNTEFKLRLQDLNPNAFMKAKQTDLSLFFLLPCAFLSSALDTIIALAAQIIL